MESARWIVLIRERFPLPVYFLLSGGFAFSGVMLGDGYLHPIPSFLSFLGILLFFFVLRIMDEIKDYEKDRIAHPQRPLPRGVLSPPQVESMIVRSSWVMAVFGLFLGGLFNWWAGLMYLGLTVHLWLMYREFYLGAWLEERPLVYAVSHQLVLIWLCLFSVFLTSPEMRWNAEPYYFALLCLGSFFSYEISRKMSPQADPVLRTYRQVYGVGGSFLIVLCTTALACYSALQLNGFTFLLIPNALLLLSFLRLPMGNHKIVEGLASVSLILHLWAVVIVETLERWI